MIDFTSCRIIPGRAYNGANGSKIAASYAGEIYMLKFPPSGDGKPTELSYTNSCISEHIASSIFNMLGIPAQETILGSYTVKGKTKTVCACKDFSTGGKRLFDFCSIKNTILDSDSNGSGTELDDIMDTIDRQQYVSPMILRSHFWDMFVADALLGMAVAFLKFCVIPENLPLLKAYLGIENAPAEAGARMELHHRVFQKVFDIAAKHTG